MRLLLSTCVVLGLTGCGLVYQSPMIRDGGDDTTPVRIVRLTRETVITANQTPYVPRSLPAVFDGTAGAGAGLRAAGPLPAAVAAEQTRPDALLTRVPPAVDPGPYKIGIGDVVLLATPSTGTAVEQLSGLLAAQNSRQGYTVQDDGSINVPNLGRVRIAGLTVEEAEAALFRRLVENQFDPTFSLEVAEFNARKVAIRGAVARPTVVPVTLTPLYLNEALAIAGGITTADMNFASVRIYRDGTLYQIPLSALMEDSSLQRIRLLDGDSVFVDTTYELRQAEAYFEQQITLVQLRQQARIAALNELNTEVALRRSELNETRTNFLTRADLGAAVRDHVYLTGEVGVQSRYPLAYGQQTSLADALFDAAGGIPITTGDVSQIYVLRASADAQDIGAVTAWHLDARNAANFVLATKFELRPDDVIFVAEQPVTRWGRVIEQIVPSLITTGVTEANK